MSTKLQCSEECPGYHPGHRVESSESADNEAPLRVITHYCQACGRVIHVERVSK